MPESTSFGMDRQRLAEQGMSLLAERVWKSQQSWFYSAAVSYGSRRLNVYIERNAYDFQSEVIVSMWTDIGWKRLIFRPMTEDMHCHGVSYTDDEKRTRGITHTIRGVMALDAHSILSEAIAVLPPEKPNDPPIGTVAWAAKKELDHYHKLHDGLSDMIESGRLERGDIPDDYEWLVEMLATSP